MNSILKAATFAYANASSILEAISAAVGAIASLFHIFHADGANGFFDKITGALASAKGFFSSK